MSLALITHEDLLDHQPGVNHPERPARLQAVLAGFAALDPTSAVLQLASVPAPRDALLRVHDPRLLGALAALAERGGGTVDPDTMMSAASWDAACLAAGAGLVAIDAIDTGTAADAFCAVRPPGHHATPNRAMGFCLLNNVAVTAATLADRGERVAIVDIDAHHGNGTQDVFYDDPRVLFVSLHQWPLYPGTGRAEERGSAAGLGTTVNIPLPARATGDVYLAALDLVVAPVIDRFAPAWLLISAGFDAHRDDPITDLGLAAGDYAALVGRLAALVPASRRIAFLEGGYDLAALKASTTAFAGAMLGHRAVEESESATSGGPGRERLAELARLHRDN